MLLEENILAPASTEPKELEDVLPEDATEHQQETFSSFCHSVFERLHKRADGKAIERHITYSAQDDDWEWVWERQTDLPAGDYQKRFDELRDYTSGQAENNMSLLDKSASDVAAKISHSGAFRGSLRSFRDFVTQMAEDYINSFPGEDNAGSNSAVHGKAKKCIKGEMSDPAQLLALFHRLEYRSGLMSLADIFVHISCGPPKGLPCAEWDPIYTSSLLKEFGFARKDFDHVRAEVGRRGLFPRPMESQGEPWPKPADFLTIALLCAKLDDKQIEQKLHDLSTCEILQATPI